MVFAEIAFALHLGLAGEFQGTVVKKHASHACRQFHLHPIVVVAVILDMLYAADVGTSSDGGKEKQGKQG